MRPAAILALILATGLLGAADLGTERKRARTLMEQNNHKEAYDLLRDLVLAEGAGGRETGDDLERSLSCLDRLQRQAERDAWCEEVAKRHAADWRVLWRLAQAYGYEHGQHSGYLVAGEFRRGHHRGGGQWVDAYPRDRVRALQLCVQAMGCLDQARGEQAEFHLFCADLVLGRNGFGEAWRLQRLTDLTVLPDYEEGYRYNRWGSSGRGAPVDEKGAPILYEVPAAWATARNDGERWRWLLAQAEQAQPGFKTQALQRRADFCRAQFGVQTLADLGRRLGGDEAPGKEGPWSLATLADDETIARLASGVQRLRLPAEHAYIALYRALGEAGDDYGWETLGQCYEDRRQLPQAAQAWGRSRRSHARDRVAQITGNWGQIQPTPTQAAGASAVFDYRFRNGKRVEFTAHAVKVAELLDAVKTHIRMRPKTLDWEQVNIGDIGWRLVEKGQGQYLGDQVAAWGQDLEPRANHYDRSVTVAAPLRAPGAYLVTATLAGGNVSRAVVWVADTALVTKPVDGRAWYLVADAASGAPVAGATVSFFGWNMEHLGRNQTRIDINEFAETSDATGQVLPDPKLMPNNRQWLAIATAPGGRFAFLGFDHVWTSAWRWDRYLQNKGFTITDRPVYRPGDTVRYKIWLRQAAYDQDGNNFARQSRLLRIHNPKGDKVVETTVTTDEFGGIEGSFPIPADATLGVWAIRVEGFSGGSFRIEEYRKPEFEVTVQAPDKPIALGERFNATINARYYFGAPVTEASVHYKVTRSAVTATWYPPMPWDWLYGPGYWWFCDDAPWYPGWHLWGCRRPSPWWWYGGRQDPPEIVQESEVPVGRDGTVQVDIDTALAKAVFGDQDHRYEISVEVVDASRRTILGNGSVTAARKPFAVTVWADRGWLRAGESLTAACAARTIDGRVVAGKGRLRLLRITYDAQRQPHETEVAASDVALDAEGIARLPLKIAESGQFRLAATVDDGQGHVIEGGQLLTVAGPRTGAQDYRFNGLEITADRTGYAPGQNVRLLVAAEQADSTVYLFLRPSNGVCKPPVAVRLDGRSALHEFAIEAGDMPNIFVEALTVGGGKVHNVMRELVVPPAHRVLDVAVAPAKTTYQPGEKTEIVVSVSAEGRPFAGTAVVTVYDKAVDYVSGGSNVPAIREHFWKWRRHHNPSAHHSLDRWARHLAKNGETGMSTLGVFGDLLEDDLDDREGGGGKPGRFGNRDRAMRRGAEAKGMAFAADAAVPCSPMASAAPRSEADGQGAFMAIGAGGGGPAGGEAPLVEATLRTKFADTALWVGTVALDAQGRAVLPVTLPENLSTWRIRVWALGDGTRVGEGSAEVVTSKDLLVRLITPRFCVERDEVVLSALVHNYLPQAKNAQVTLELAGGTLNLSGEARRTVTLPAGGGEARVDWAVTAVREGEAVVRVKALTDAVSDAMELRFPVKVHGAPVMISRSAALRVEDEQAVMAFEIPAQRRVDQTRLTLRWSPTLAGALVDALPYLVSYPYGCTEQTLNRFLPTVIVQKILTDLKVDLAAVKTARANLNAQELGDAATRREQWKQGNRHAVDEGGNAINPVFDTAEVALMVKKGLSDLAAMQLSDGGWGWFSGWGEHSSAHTTATVLRGLLLAKANGIAVLPGMIDRGAAWLDKYQAEQVRLLDNFRKKERPKEWKEFPDNLDALVHLTLVEAGKKNGAMRAYLYEHRGTLAVYGLCLVGLGEQMLGDAEKTAMCVRNIGQFLKQDEANQTAWLELGNGGYWWWWYGSENEAHAYYLKLLAATDAKGQIAPRLVKYLLNNRKHAARWESTRDTGLIIEAMADYLRASGETDPDLEVEVLLDGKVLETAKVTAATLFTFDGTVELAGAAVPSGKHELQIRKRGRGPVYANAYVELFSLEDRIAPQGLEVTVQRNVFRLVRDDAADLAEGQRGQAVDIKRERWKRLPLEYGGRVASGDLIEVELVLESKNDYEYLLFADPKPAGFEADDQRSGWYSGGGLSCYRELRDDRVCFFLQRLMRGKHSVSYRLRAETPGTFAALPAQASAMYAPELRGNSASLRLGVDERKPAPK